ncbi:MAG: AAA family ATPase [Rhodobacteraceae bacterium]|nr:AAA family ATPase [Paracoccaceae bacterium]
MQRIMIVGQPGSGKSTLARELGLITGLPVFHVDHINWQPGWVSRPPADRTRLCQEVEAREAWIFEGGHSATWANRLARADMLIWLDLPYTLRFWRIVKRTVVWHGRTRPDLPENCPEGFHRETLPFWRYVWRTRATARARIASLVTGTPVGVAIRHLTSPRAVRAFLSDLRAA